MPGFWEKISMTSELMPGDDAEAETFLLKEKIEKIQNQFNEPRKVSITEALGITQVERSREEVIKAHLQTLNECKTLRNIEMFANAVQRLNEPVLFEAYNNKKKELQ
jgi:hypothetical protein